MTARERLRLGPSVSAIMFGAPPPLAAGRKPWGDRDPAPWGDGDSDGEDHGVHEGDPGEEMPNTPSPEPGGDSLNLRASFTAAAEAAASPEAQRALLAIEARLAEITLFMKAARLGASSDTTLKLNVLAHIL